MKCNCKTNCIKTKQNILENIDKLYKACPQCHTKTLKKAIPLKRQIKLEKIDKNYKKCTQCGKRHIDIVMAHTLKILIENKQMPETSSIRKTGTPLITPATYLEHLPYLSKETLVLITTNCDKTTAKKIKTEVPEIKAIIKGDTQTTAGKLDENTKTNNYDLLTGCDIRCDIQNTDKGPIILYKQQSKQHIEYPKQESPKIEQLRKTLEKYENPTVLDAMSGPGTLGIYALQKNATHVTFNDINPESTESLKTNLEMNQIPKEKYQIYNENILELTKKLEKQYNLGIIDTFPGIDTKKYTEALEKICDEVIII